VIPGSDPADGPGTVAAGEAGGCVDAPGDVAGVRVPGSGDGASGPASRDGGAVAVGPAPADAGAVAPDPEALPDVQAAMAMAIQQIAILSAGRPRRMPPPCSCAPLPCSVAPLPSPNAPE